MPELWNFLVDNFSKHYFIEVNPRIQVEHTITEMTTGIDIVQSQILIAEGHRLDDKEINIKSQDDIKFNGYAIQCRVTTEDPANNFAPDTGRIDVYRTGSGFGVRLDGGNGFAGSIISPYYDSLLVKVTTHSRNFEDAIKKSIHSLRELKISGVKTNIGFLLNVLNNEIFKKGLCTTGFIAENPHIFDIKPRNFREVKLLNFIGENVVNNKKRIEKSFDNPVVPVFEKPEKLSGTKYILDDKGPKGLVDWIKSQDKLLLTDTTLRDAHQSLMATRMRTVDMLKIATRGEDARQVHDRIGLEGIQERRNGLSVPHVQQGEGARMPLLRPEVRRHDVGVPVQAAQMRHQLRTHLAATARHKNFFHGPAPSHRPEGAFIRPTRPNRQSPARARRRQTAPPPRRGPPGCARR